MSTNQMTMPRIKAMGVTIQIQLSLRKLKGLYRVLGAL